MKLEALGWFSKTFNIIALCFGPLSVTKTLYNNKILQNWTKASTKPNKNYLI